jgi:hypothetical protein
MRWAEPKHGVDHPERLRECLLCRSLVCRLVRPQILPQAPLPSPPPPLLSGFPCVSSDVRHGNHCAGWVQISFDCTMHVGTTPPKKKQLAAWLAAWLHGLAAARQPQMLRWLWGSALCGTVPLGHSVAGNTRNPGHRSHHHAAPHGWTMHASFSSFFFSRRRQWDAQNTAGACWMGKMTSCVTKDPAWTSRGRKVASTRFAPVVPPPQSCPESPVCTAYVDSSWRSIDVPHDFIVEGTFTPTADRNHGYLPFNTSFYRKHFTVPLGYRGMNVYLDFDGVYRAADFFLNGKYIGHHESGYAPFRVYLHNATAAMAYGSPNVLAVRVDALSHQEGWFYEGETLVPVVFTFVTKFGPCQLAVYLGYNVAILGRARACRWKGDPRFQCSGLATVPPLLPMCTRLRCACVQKKSMSTAKEKKQETGLRAHVQDVGHGSAEPCH